MSTDGVSSLSTPPPSPSCSSRCCAGLRKMLPRLILITGYVVFILIGGLIFHLVEQPRYEALAGEWEEAHDKGEELNVDVFYGESWSFGNSMLFCMTTITTIGYGHMIPNTMVGKALCIIYTMVGIPLSILVIGDIGRLYAILIMKYFNKCFGRCCKSRRGLGNGRKSNRMTSISKPNNAAMTANAGNGIDAADVTEVEKNDQLDLTETTVNKKENGDVNEGVQSALTGGAVKENGGQEFASNAAVINDDVNDDEEEYDVLSDVPIFLPPIIFWLYIITSAPMLCWIEGWSFGGSMYFLFITITTIGFGDFVPRSSMGLVSSWFGLLVTAMCVALSYQKVLCASRWILSVLEAKINPPRNTVQYANI